MGEETLNDARARFHQASAEHNHALERRGDLIAEKLGWNGLEGLDAVRYYLMQKHHWTPAELFSMSEEHLRFAMREEHPDGIGSEESR